MPTYRNYMRAWGGPHYPNPAGPAAGARDRDHASHSTKSNTFLFMKRLTFPAAALATAPGIQINPAVTNKRYKSISARWRARRYEPLHPAPPPSANQKIRRRRNLYRKFIAEPKLNSFWTFGGETNLSVLILSAFAARARARCAAAVRVEPLFVH
ncbi:hypothetical protein EVAR_79100_1 [Eumeta japonica]|uniref:Uncharacterized protein n=1 Tax=Eumeta variegata TaxID=151549 RepID=A0A4C1X3N6_EUMVA|nr:hypothetical protein EVAR_79100_1 [Eumeta japonica]